MASHLTQQATLFDQFGTDLEQALTRIGQISRCVSESISTSRKAQRSQYFTEMAIAQQMANMLDVPGGAIVGDHGAGTGILGATVATHALADAPADHEPVTLKAYETDELLYDAIHQTMGEVKRFADQQGKAHPEYLINGDFTDMAEQIASLGEAWSPVLDVAILNPPYIKLNQSTPLAKVMRRWAPVPNLYAVFVVLTVLMLRDGGQMVAILPRSFTSGTYFKGFRQWLKSQGSIDWFVRYQRRSNAFRNDNVLQENVILRFTNGVEQVPRIRISLCDTPDAPPLLETVAPARDLLPPEDDLILVPATEDEMSALAVNRELPHSMADLGLAISTGKLEDFRVREQLHPEVPDHGDWYPVVYSQHYQRGDARLTWSPSIAGKPAVWAPGKEVSSQARCLPRGNYVLVKRISANDDSAGRVHPVALTEDSCLPGDWWAIDNHIQIIAGVDGNPLTPSSARQLANHLMETQVDHLMRLTSGTTQLNRSDLNQIRFPLHFMEQ